jgi:hypothetical protein
VRFLSGSQQDQQTPCAFDNAIGGGSCFVWNFREVTTSLRRAIRALASKCVQPIGILEHHGDWFRFAQSLQTQRSRLSV